jgi:hypothetical protein
MAQEIWFTLELRNRNSGKLYGDENFDNEEDAIKEGDRFYAAHQYKDESDLTLIRHVREETAVKVWSLDNQPAGYKALHPAVGAVNEAMNRKD